MANSGSLLSTYGLRMPFMWRSKLEISFSLELPLQGDDDEITLQTLKCAGYGFHGVAAYRESRHGNLGSESWTHDGCLEDEAMERFYEVLLLCPKPRDRRCSCPAHVAFAQQDWVNPAHLGNRHRTQV